MSKWYDHLKKDPKYKKFLDSEEEYKGSYYFTLKIEPDTTYMFDRKRNMLFRVGDTNYAVAHVESLQDAIDAAILDAKNL